MDELVAFLRARLDEAEARAKAEGHRDIDEGLYYSCPATRNEPLGDLPWGEDACDCGLAARRDRTLREVAGKRLIVRDANRLLLSSDRLRVGPYWDGIRETYQYVLRCLVVAWSDHPGYDPAWSPDH